MPIIGDDASATSEDCNDAMAIISAADTEGIGGLVSMGGATLTDGCERWDE